MGIFQGIFYHYPVLIKGEHLFFGKHHTSHTIDCSGNGIACKFADIFMTFGIIIVSGIFMKPQIKGCIMLNNSFIQ